MKHGILAALASFLPIFAQAAPLTVTLHGLSRSGFLPASAAFCGPARKRDENPGIDWSPGPAGTQSYALIMVDPDVVRDLSLMNRPGVTIQAAAPRMSIYHWALIDIPAMRTAIAPGEDSSGFIPGGKQAGPGPVGVRGTNDYWMEFNLRPGTPAAMRGPYAGYDGPCPPANDLLVHDYRFEVFALDIRTLPLSGRFFAPAVLQAMRGHILAQGEADAKFTLTGARSK